MDAKDLRIETALGERNDGSKYSQSGVALQCNRNKSYQDIGSNPLAKAEVAVRPCAVIGPDRVVPPPASNDAYLKKASVDIWPCPDNLYARPPEYPHKPPHNVNPIRNISPRQTFQENMQRILVPPTYSAIKNADETILNHVQDRNAAISKNTKQTMASEAKYCDVPYSVNLLTNEHKNIRETEMCMPSVNSPLTRTAPHGWPPSGVNLHAPRTYGAHDVYQYPQFPSCAGPRPPVMPMARSHRTFQEDGSYIYPDPYYQDTSVRFKPYPSVKERYPHARYDFISNYPNPFHPPTSYASHKYDIPNTRPPHPYPVYPHMKYLDNRVPDPNIEGYQRPNQQSINYNMPFRNQVIHPTYAPGLGNTQNKLPSYPPDKSSNKLTLDNSKAYVDYENTKAKYSLPDSYFISEMARAHQVQKQMAMPNYTSHGMHPVPLQQYHRKDNMPMKTYEYMPHYRHFEHPIGFNHPPQFSPSSLAISPTDSNTSNDTTQTQGTSHEDCGYVSQSSTTSARSVDSNINRLHHEYYRRYDYRYRPIIGNSHMMHKANLTPANSKEKDKIDVRQFLSMWNEGDEDSANNTKEITGPNNYRRQESAKSQDQLYVLGLVNVPSEELAKYEHIQKVSKLPENIKGYNSIELLNQFEEVIESSNMNSFKSSISKEFMPMKDRKNAIKQIVEVLPRPLSPLDVEAKISQSVIHKEVGCNFEIKPCSPKMMNVEIAAPIQNILDERAIEKVSNPLSNKAKSPLSMRIDGNTAHNNIQRQESTHTTFENVSCKMIGSPFTASNMDSVKTNYSLHDLETSSGVCLASLPRLDNEIELNFPEVNQQFINANKEAHNLHEKHREEAIQDSKKFTTSTNNDKDGNISEKYTNVPVEDSSTEHTKLSKYRKTKVNSLEYPEDESNANAIRTNSVIIENPENVRKLEENRERNSPHRNAGEEENAPMNLTSQNSENRESESETAVSPKAETHIMECALDFSLNKSENGLPLIDAHDDELINTAQRDMLMNNVDSYFNLGSHIKQITEHPQKSFILSSECASYESNTKSIIVKNNQVSSARCDSKINVKDDGAPFVKGQSVMTSDLSALYKSDVYDTDNKTIGEINFDLNKTKTRGKASSTNVIVKHKHKNKSKKSKSKFDITKTCNSDQKFRYKNIKNKKEHNTHENDVFHSKYSGQKSNKTKSVIKNNGSDESERMKAVVSDICKNEVIKTISSSNNLDEYNKNVMISKNAHFIENNVTIDDQPNSFLPVNEESVNIFTNIINASAETNDDNKLDSKRLIRDTNGENNDTTPLICDKDEVLQSNAEIYQTNKYNNDLISEGQLFVDKKSVNRVNLSPSNLINHEKNASVDVIKLLDDATKANVVNYFKRNSDTSKDHVHKSEILEPGASATKQEDKCHIILVSESELLENKQCCIDNGELNINSFDDEVFNNSVKNTACAFIKEKVTEKNENIILDSLSNEIKLKDAMTTTVHNSEHRCAEVLESKLLEDNKYRIDSGYQSSKTSFAESDEAIIVFSEKSSEDSVFVEQEPGINKITPNGCVDNNSGSKDILQMFCDKSISTRTSSSSLVETLMIKNKTTEHSNQYNEIKIQSNNLQSCNVFDNVDANMEILFAQENEEMLPEKRNVDNINIRLQIDYLMALKTSQSKEECIDVANDQTPEETDNEVYPNEHVQINDNVGNANKMEIDDVSLVMQYNDQNTISSNPVENIDMVIDEPCAKSLPKNGDNIIYVASCVKKHSGYHGKELFSPRIQKLIIYNEGKTGIQSVDDVANFNLENNYIEVKSFEKPNIDTAIQNNDIKKLQEKSDIDSFIQNDDVEVKSFDKSSIDNVMKKDDFEVKTFKEPNIETVIQNDDSLEKSNIIDAIQNNDVEVKPEEPNIESVLQNDNAKYKLEEPNIESVVQNKDVKVESLEKTNIEGVLKSDDVEVNSLEKLKIESVIQNDDVEVKSIKEPNMNSIIQIDDVDGKSFEVPIIDSIIQNDNVEEESLEKPNIDSNIQNYVSLEKSNIVEVIQNDDVEVKSIEEPSNKPTILEKSSIVRLLQNDDVEIKSVVIPLIDSVIHADGEFKLLEIPTTDTITKVVNLDDPVNEVYPESESSIQDLFLKIDVEFDKINSVTNTNISVDSNESIGAPNISMGPINSFDVMSNQRNTVEVNVVESNSIENDCAEDCDVQNNLINTQEISFSYPNNSIISQITGSIFDTNHSTSELKSQNNNVKDDIKCEDASIHCSPIIYRRSLKRSFSDSALNASVGRSDSEGIGNLHWSPKRNKIGDFDNYLPNNRRNSVIEENVSFCILIDDNCIITEENEEKICIAELQEDYITEIETGNDCDNNDSLKEFNSTAHETDVILTDSAVIVCEEENPIQDTWVEDITCAEDVFSDEVAENVVISAPSSPTDSASEYDYDEPGIYGSISSCSHTDKVKFMHGEKMSEDDTQIVEALYRTPHMNIMNKTLLYGDKNVESDNDQENILIESDDWKPSPTHSPDYIDPTNTSNDFRLETPENKENIFIKELSPLRRIDDYLDVSSAETETDERNTLPHHVPESDKTTQDGTVYSCESSLDNVFDYKLKDESTISTTTHSSSSSPEVSSTTSEEKNSGILLKITNLNGSRVSQINENETRRSRCKFTEKKEYSTSNLNFPNRPLITKAAQKYIPPIKESIRDLKVKITLPQQSLLKLKQLKLSRNESKVRKQQNVVSRITKKPKPNFDDVLKSIDEIQIKRHKEKSKKMKTVIPKVLIKKNENGSHYASTPKRDTLSPDLTGRKWQPWVFLEKNHFIDKMAIKNKTRAIFSHRKKTYVLAEKFKKYKSVSSTKFVISQPTNPGQLKYTIRLKHSF